MKAGKVLYFGVVAILVIVLIASSLYVANYFLNSHRQKQEFDDLAAIVESIQADMPSEPATKENPEESTAGTEESTGGILPEYAPLYTLNSDMVGWLKIEDTRVNYPVMQTPDYVDYYLHRNFSKADSSQGCLYAREECDINAPSDNITIYGHNMRDGSMFADLNKYLSRSFWEEHDTIIFDTLTEHHTYRIFAVFRTTASVGQGFAYHRFVDAQEERDFLIFVDSCKNLSLYETGLTPVYGDKIICLSTCEYTQTNGRLVVAAYRVD